MLFLQGKQAKSDAPTGPYNTDASDYDPKTGLRRGAPGGPGGRPGGTPGGPQSGRTTADGPYPPGGLTAADELEAADTFGHDATRRTPPSTATKGGRKATKPGTPASPSLKSQETTRKTLSSSGGTFSSSFSPLTTTTSHAPGKYLEHSEISPDTEITEPSPEGEEYGRHDYVTYYDLE